MKWRTSGLRRRQSGRRMRRWSGRGYCCSKVSSETLDFLTPGNWHYCWPPLEEGGLGVMKDDVLQGWTSRDFQKVQQGWSLLGRLTTWGTKPYHPELSGCKFGSHELDWAWDICKIADLSEVPEKKGSWISFKYSLFGRGATQSITWRVSILPCPLQSKPCLMYFAIEVFFEIKCTACWFDIFIYCCVFLTFPTLGTEPGSH